MLRTLKETTVGNSGPSWWLILQDQGEVPQERGIYGLSKCEAGALRGVGLGLEEAEEDQHLQMWRTIHALRASARALQQRCKGRRDLTSTCPRGNRACGRWGRVPSGFASPSSPALSLAQSDTVQHSSGVGTETQMPRWRLVTSLVEEAGLGFCFQNQTAGRSLCFATCTTRDHQLHIPKPQFPHP